jgi:hypothetical protein
VPPAPPTLRAVQAAVGFSTHSGWAVAVTARVDDDGHLAVVDRRRVTLIGDDLPRMAYHAAAELDADAAERLVASVEASIADHARAVVGDLVAAPDVAVAGIAVVGQPREIPGVAVVLASHARMHACEGEQYRRGIVEAANDLALPVLRIGPDELTGRATELLEWSPERTEQELAAVRAALGAPWQADHKQAALAALALLRSEPSR